MAVSLRELRRSLKRQRAALSKQQQAIFSQRAVSKLCRCRSFRAARNIALYLPVRGEIDPRPLLQHAHPQQRFYLPVLSPNKHSGLVFVRWTKHTRFRRNRFKIPEPCIRSSHSLPATALDWVVTPLLGFDSHGNRLGMGGGFYDRSFAFKRLYLGKSKRPLLIGFAYHFQHITPPLQAQNWDVPLDAICTDKTYQHFSAKK